MKLKFKIVSLVLAMSLTFSPIVLAQVQSTCRHCGNWVASTSRQCPVCGKNPKSFTGSPEGDFLAALFLLAILGNSNNNSSTHRNGSSTHKNSPSTHNRVSSHREQYPTGVTPWLFTHLITDGKNAKRLKKNGGYTTRRKNGRTYYTYDGTYPNQIIEDRNGFPTYNLHFNTRGGADYFEKMLRDQKYVRNNAEDNAIFRYIWYRNSDGAVIYQGAWDVDNGSDLFFFRY